MIVRDGGHRLHYNRWGGQEIVTDTVAGPAAALRLAESREDVTAGDGWLDDVWSEGGVLIDVDERVLLLDAGYVEGAADAEMLRGVFARTWSGWRVRWAIDGIGELRRYVGETDPPDFEADPVPIPLCAPDREAGAVITVFDGTAVHPYATDDTLRDLLPIGPALIDALGEARVTGPVDNPYGGLHLDLPGRRGYVWSTVTLDGRLRALPRTWPGWAFTRWDLDAAPHLAVARGAVTLRPREPAATAAQFTDLFARAWAGRAERGPTEPEAAAVFAAIDATSTDDAFGIVHSGKRAT